MLPPYPSLHKPSSRGLNSRRTGPPSPKCAPVPSMTETCDQLLISHHHRQQQQQHRLQNWGEDEFESPELLSFPRELEEDDFLNWLDECETSNLSSFLEGFEHNKFASWLPSTDHFSSHFDPEAEEEEELNADGTEAAAQRDDGRREVYDNEGDESESEYEECEDGLEDEGKGGEESKEDETATRTTSSSTSSSSSTSATAATTTTTHVNEQLKDTAVQKDVEVQDEQPREPSQGRSSPPLAREATTPPPPSPPTTCPIPVTRNPTPPPAPLPSHSHSSSSSTHPFPTASGDEAAAAATAATESPLLPPIPENAVLVTPTPKTSAMKLDSPSPSLVDSSTFSSGLKQYFVNGAVKNASVEAFPDSGADRCYISSQLASNLGVNLVPGTERDVQLANKKSVESPGMVEVPFKFEGEQHEHTLSCWIIPNCIHDLILGRDFLGATKTLTQYARRIGSKVVSWPGKLRLSYLDGERQRLWGWFGDFFVDALPDTGSDLMLMSGQFARRIGLQADESFENWLEVEFADGTTEWTSGVVRNVPWTVGDTTIRCDFHVLEDLRVDVILSKDYLFGMNAFSEYGKFFSDTTAEVDLYKLYNSGSVGKWNGTPSIFNDEHLDELDNSDAESSIVEVSRQQLSGYDFFDDEILAFPKGARRPLQLKPARKRKRDDAREAFAHASQHHPSTTTTTTTSPSSTRRSHRHHHHNHRSSAYSSAMSTISTSTTSSSYSGADTYRDFISSKRGMGMGMGAMSGSPAKLTSKNLQKIAKRWENEVDLRFYL